MEITEDQVFQCCSNRNFAVALAKGCPYRHFDQLVHAARRVWWEECGIKDWLEAFDAHPKIGDVEALERKCGPRVVDEKQEQSSMIASATEQDLRDLAAWNKKYMDKFGHIFLICASGKTASDMLAALKMRYTRNPSVELITAAGEQMKITEDRLRTALGIPSAAPVAPQLRTALSGHPSPITTHVLDTSRGCPAEGVPIALQKPVGPNQLAFEDLAKGITGLNGRASLTDMPPLRPGNYRLKFMTGEYLAKCRRELPTFYKDPAFYPEANIDFEIGQDQCQEHFHIPLLLSPYGYTTYRGS